MRSPVQDHRRRTHPGRRQVSCRTTFDAAAVAGHHAHLTAHHDHHATVTVDEDCQRAQEDKDEVAATVDPSLLFRLEVRRAESVLDPCGDERSWSGQRDPTDPGERHRRVYHPALQVPLAPEGMDHLQVEFQTSSS